MEEFELTRKNKRNIYKKYKRLQYILLQGQNALFNIVNIIEKIKNLFTWYYYEKTKVFFLFLLLALAAFIVLPLRFIMLVGLFKSMGKGKIYHKRTQEFNKIIIYELFKVVINENHLKVMQQYITNYSKEISQDSRFFSYEGK